MTADHGPATRIPGQIQARTGLRLVAMGVSTPDEVGAVNAIRALNNPERGLRKIHAATWPRSPEEWEAADPLGGDKWSIDTIHPVLIEAGRVKCPKTARRFMTLMRQTGAPQHWVDAVLAVEALYGWCSRQAVSQYAGVEAGPGFPAWIRAVEEAGYSASSIKRYPDADVRNLAEVARALERDPSALDGVCSAPDYLVLSAYAAENWPTIGLQDFELMQTAHVKALAYAREQTLDPARHVQHLLLAAAHCEAGISDRLACRIDELDPEFVEPYRAHRARRALGDTATSGIEAPGL